MQKTISYFISKEQEGNYLKIPFEVPDNIDRLIVEYTYPRFDNQNDQEYERREEKNIIDFGLYGKTEEALEGKFLGASGSNRQRIQVSSKSDPGFANVAIEAGTWQVMAGAYKVQDEGVTVEYTITFIEKEWKLYKGDTHSHTTSSDGWYSFEELIQKAEKEGLDYLIVTDHNNYTQNERITGREKITILPGTEWTHYRGHANLLGVRKAIQDPFSVETIEDVNQLLNEARKNGATVSVNHPYCPNCGWQWGLDETNFDLVEIWNGGLRQSSNKEALEWWKSQLIQENYFPIVAGSDFHNVGGLRNLAQPCTGVWSKSNRPEEIMNAIAKGHTYICYAIEGPSILLRAENGIQGDQVEEKKVEIQLEALKKGDSVHFITDIETEEWVVDKDFVRYSTEKVFEQEKFLRIEIFREPYSETLQMPVSLSNPIYFKS